MNERQLDSLAKAVREQGIRQDDALTDLVYDPVQGIFVQQQKGLVPVGSGEVVTEMTQEGFAA